MIFSALFQIQTNDLLQAVFDSIPSTAILDEYGIIIATNQGWQTFAHDNQLLTDASSIGVNYLTVCDTATGDSSEEASHVAAGIRDVLAGRRGEFIIEYPCHAPDEQRWFIMRVRPVYHHALAQVVVTHENITHLKLAALEADTLKEEKNRLFKGFVRKFSHDIRTQLTVIKLKLGIIRPHVEAEAQHNFMQMETGVTQLADQLYRLVETFEFEQADFKLERKATNLRVLIENILTQVEDATTQKQQSLSQHIPDLTISAEAPLLALALGEIIQNAIDYTPDGGKIEVEVYTEAQQAIIEITDTGIGIAPRDLPYIFDRFYRTDSSRGHSNDHSGLGLTLAKNIIQAHGGQIEVESVISKGSLFRVLLPQ